MDESNRALFSRWLLVLGSGAVLACSGGTAGSRRYQGVSAVQAISLATKGNVTVVSGGGGVFVDTAGDSGQLAVAAVPFAFAEATEAGRREAIATMAGAAPLTLSNDGAGVSATQPGDSQVGADLIVHLPNPFHGLLVVQAHFGNVTYWASPSAPGASFRVGVGDIDIENAGNQLTIEADDGDVLVVAAATLAGPDTQGNPTPPSSIVTRRGNIIAKIPDATSLTINASTAAGGLVMPQADQDALMTDSGKSALITVGDGTAGTLTVATGDGNVTFLRP
jgi:hypothetical protein